MKKTIYLLLAMPLIFASCNKAEEIASEETIQVSFSAGLPQALETRATNSGVNVDKVVCAVFEENTEIAALREVLDIVDGQPIVFAPHLLKGRTYDIVFWACKDGAYDTSDLTAITRATPVPAGTTEEDFDAFTNSVEVTVANSDDKTVTLNRPLAQLNIGVTQDDWNTVVNKFNMTPSTMVITIYGKSAFNALTGNAVGSDAQITYNLNCSGNDLTVNDKTYKSIASCYVLPDAQKENFDITYTINDQNSSAIRSNASISSIPLQANYKTNVVGGLMTGVIKYEISIQQAFNNAEHNKTVE